MINTAITHGQQQMTRQPYHVITDVLIYDSDNENDNNNNNKDDDDDHDSGVVDDDDNNNTSYNYNTRMLIPVIKFYSTVYMEQRPDSREWWKLALLYIN